MRKYIVKTFYFTAYPDNAHFQIQINVPYDFDSWPTEQRARYLDKSKDKMKIKERQWGGD